MATVRGTLGRMVTSTATSTTFPTGEDDPPGTYGGIGAWLVRLHGDLYDNDFVVDDFSSYGFIRINLSIITEK